MPKRSDAFQTLVAQIQHHIGLNAACSVEESKMLPHEDTGELREVDIVVEGTINNIDVVISFECCRTRRKAGSQWVESMIGKHRKLPSHRLILVSGSGFTKPALLAIESEKDVEAVTFDEASDVDWGSYAERMTQLRFGGLSLEPDGLSVNWIEPGVEVPAKRTIDGTTVFRRLSDGSELNGMELASAYITDSRVGKSVMEQYFGQGKSRELRAESDKDPFTASGHVDLTFTWDEDSPDWEIDFSSCIFPVRSIVVKTKVHIKDSPLELSFRSFMGKRVAHAVLEKPFKDVQGKLRKEISVAFTQSEAEKPVVSLSYTSHIPNEQKTFFATFTDANIEGGDCDDGASST